MTIMQLPSLPPKALPVFFAFALLAAFPWLGSSFYV